MEEDLAKVQLDLDSNGAGWGGGSGPPFTSRDGEEIAIGTDFTPQLFKVNESIDLVYSKWSLFPSNPGKDKCGKYLKSGICPQGAKCRYDHPFHEPISPAIETDTLLFLTFITERLMKILKTFSYEAAVDVLTSLCKIVSLLESYYEIALTHPSYGQICYLYGDVVIRLSLDIDKFCSNKLSQRRTTPRFKRKGPQLLDSNFEVFETSSERLEALNQKWIDWEEEIRKQTVLQLEEEDEPAVAHITNKLTDCILEYAQETLTQQHSMRESRENIRRNLLHLFQQQSGWSEVDLLAFGSHANLLGTPDSDMDLTLQFPGSPDPIQVLETAGKVAEEAGFVLKELVKETRVPVLKLYEGAHRIEIDIVVNNSLAIYNTTLLRNYALVDPRVRPLVLAIKRWAHRRACNNPRNATLSSYAWTLMVLYFLKSYSPNNSQLPSIEAVGKIVEERQLSTDVLDDLRQPSNSSLGKLLIHFFAFYGTCSPHGFQPFHTIVSLRNTFRVYKKCSSLHTSVRVKSVCDVLDDHLGLLQAVKAASSELIGEADTARSEVKDISNMVAYSLSPSWRFCIEDPYEEHDLGRVIFCLTGQIHMMNEMKRCLTLFNDLIVKHRLYFQNRSLDEFHSSHFPEEFNFWTTLSLVNHAAPIAIKTCGLCGQQGHFIKECDLMRCHLCNEKGHFLKDCIQLFCSNCRQQGHFSKDCKKERLCRSCKQPGHQVKDCPFKICGKCGSRSHTTFRCKANTIKSTELGTDASHLSNAAEATVPSASTSGSHFEAVPQPSREDKLVPATSESSSLGKTLPRRVPPLPIEAKKNSMAKLEHLQPRGIKIVPPDSPILLSPDDSMGSPQPPSDAKIIPQLHHQETDQLISESKEGGRKKKKRKPKNKGGVDERSRAFSVESAEPLEVQRQPHNPPLELSSTNSSPRDLHVPQRRDQGRISPVGQGTTTSERFAYAIRNPPRRASSIEEKKEIKTSVHFDNDATADSKLDSLGSQDHIPPDSKIAAPKTDETQRRIQSKGAHHSHHHHHESKYMSVNRPPSQLMTHRAHIEDVSDSCDSPRLESTLDSKKVPLRPKINQSKHQQREETGAVSPSDIAREGNDLSSLESPAPPAYRKRVLMKRESKIIETKSTES